METWASICVQHWRGTRIDAHGWRDRIANEEIIKRLGENRTIINSIYSRRKNWVGHVIRGDMLLRAVLEGRMMSKRGRGRPYTGLLDELIGKYTYENMERRAADRLGWRIWTPWICHIF